MKKDYLSEFLPDLDLFKENTMKFHNGEMTVAEYKGFSGGFGSYAQRGGERHMLRLRMAGGRLTKNRLKFIAESCEKYHIDTLKMTTCQSIQLHNLEADDLCDMIADAWRADMISRGGGGDFPRNVMVTPLSGLVKEEAFDVLPFAEEAASYLMHYIKEVKFPRKLKVCFSNTPANEPHATFRDLGFVARPDGTFDIFIAGGLGNSPKLGVKVAENVAPSDILYYIDAMVRTFTTYGNYENRGKSRTRYLQDTLGADGLKTAYLEKLAEVQTEYGDELKITVDIPEIHKPSTGTVLEDSRILAQKQDGLYAVFYQPVGGILAPAKLVQLYHAIEAMEDVEIRLTPEEGMYIVNCNSEEAAKILNITQDGAATEFERSVACIGAKTCQVGIGDSRAMLRVCVDKVRKEHFKDGVLPKLHFSGCPSSCSAHQTAEIGFRGGIKQTPDGPKPAFAIFIGGCALEGHEVIAGTGKAIACDDIPDFLIELGQMITNADSTYKVWVKDHTADFEELIARYTA